MDLFGKLWSDYESFAVPAGAGTDQREAMRRCFYAGAAAFGHLIDNMPRDPKRAREYAEAIEKELMEHLRSIDPGADVASRIEVHAGAKKNAN